jgi:hypothetical protein
MVTIVDPHVKRDSSYYIFSEAEAAKHFVRNRHGGDFDGCVAWRKVACGALFQQARHAFWRETCRGWMDGTIISVLLL